MKDFNTLDDFDVSGKTVLLRVDINLPLNKDSLEIVDDNRVRMIIPTLRELLDRGAKVVILAHQGRPGSWDFTSLERHSKLLSSSLGSEVRYVDDVIGEEAEKAIKGLRKGEAILLGNVRALECEMEKASMEVHGESELVKKLAPMAKLYVNDAFAASHRPQCSLVGFQAKLPSAAGRLLERELDALSSVFDQPRKPSVFVLGGAKYSDAIQVIDRLIGSEKASWVIVTGACANFFLKAWGMNLGPKTEEFLSEEMTPELLEEAKTLLRNRGNRMILPFDVAVDEDGTRVNVMVGDLPSDYPILDIGERSIIKFCKVLRAAKTIFISGPAGMIEREKFAHGTEELMRAAVASDAFSMVGGGHTVGMVNRLGLADEFSYVSTGGGALETYLRGKPLPVVEALKAAKR
ncbi:MAG TPA: phosphoglycerate kinase [Methanomassiliicoccales archaeon]|nr:phosphoglycerate kinase [Methanomassiliicoccales archaeon]